MQDGTIENKVKVFISSICGGRYTIVRKALKALLLESNMTTVYTFETEGASSQDVTRNYINSLDDSDLCIFLIDNKDGVTDPVLVEHKRARELGKKSIYLFCDENQKEPTPLQTEIIESRREKFFVVHEFSDLIQQGYQDVMRDITSIYRIYCRGQLNDKKDQVLDADTVTQVVDTYRLDKEMFKGFDSTKNELVQIVNPVKTEVAATSDLDDIFRNLLRIILGKEPINNINFDTLKKKLLDVHEDFLKDFISLRIDVIKAYFNSDLENCLTKLTLLYDKSISSVKIPNWLINDVLIDMRNAQHWIDEVNSQFTVKNKGQELLEKNSETVYYPLLDRYVVNYNEDVLSKCLDSNIDSPYSTRIGGIDFVFQNIASAFIVAVMYGSLTQILILRERLIESLSIFSFIYRDHSMFIELIKLMVMSQKDKEIGDILRAYNQTTDMINENDIEYLLEGISLVPLPHKRVKSKLVLFKYFGYYFSDGQYINLSKQLMNEINNWIDNDNRVFSLSDVVFKALTGNIYRLKNEEVLKIIIFLFEKGLKRWFDEALKVIRVVDFSCISEETESKVVHILVSLASEKEVRNNCHYLEETLISVRKGIKSQASLIDSCVKEHMEDFYQNSYSLEIVDKDQETDLKHVARFVDIINQQNQKQGDNGTYHIYSGNPYVTIRNIIEYDDLQLRGAHIKPIISAIDSTMFASKQTISAKIEAIKLLIYLKNKFWVIDELNAIFERWMVNQNEILCGHEDHFFEKDSITTLKFNFLMLKVCFGKYDLGEFLSTMANFAHQNDYDIIKAMQCLETLLYNIDFEKMDESVLTVITQFTISMSIHKEKNVRLYSVRALFLLCRSKLRSLALLQLSKMMDNDIYEVKIAILSKIKKISIENGEIVKYINQKGRIDNHFLVRKTTQDISL